MIGRFELQGTNQLVLVLTPERGEDLLMAAWMRYDANIFTAIVERGEDKRIFKVTFQAGSE